MHGTIRRGIFRLGMALVTSVAWAGTTAGVHAQAFGNSRLYVGTLTCNVSSGVGLLFGSTKQLGCLLVRSDGTAETYDGRINRFGIDIGFTKAMHVAWHVYSLDEKAPVGVLAGNYGGTQASIAVGGTAGSNALYGGANNAIILTSVVVQGGSNGLNFADGIAEMSLVGSGQ
jgi:hypothetical protein